MASTVALVDEKGLDRMSKDETVSSSDKGSSDTLPNNDSGNRGWLFPALETVSSYIPIPKASSLTSWYSTEGKQRSDDIDRWLEAEGIRSQRCFRAILLGDREQTETFWKQSRLLSEPLSEEELQSLRCEVRRVFLERFWNEITMIVDRVEKKRQDEESDDPTSDFLETLQKILEIQESGESETTQAERLISMCQDPDFREAFQQEKDTLEDKDAELLGFKQPKISTCTCDADRYTLTQLQRVFAPNYQATEHDWFHFDHRFPSMVRETQVNMTDYSLAITDVLMSSCRRSRWLHLYDDCACMLFVADISRYWIRIEEVMDFENYDLLKGTIQVFESIANSDRLSKKPLHLVLSNVTAFKAQLTLHPLVESFPEYTGTTDEEAIQFVVKEFLAVVKKRDVVNVSTSDITALTGIGRVLDDLERTVLKPLVEELGEHGGSQ
ncbi:hypothetical protein CDV31_012563 [Fusarium ambrosium]|uniref:Uncharacterized protein n=1 Tax=Fusarium ambrosium TaxID=131363 RepID=A0A428T8Y7_9HYPO|nr:hypothetical protein CDV31_012563 [Fusarium ambrosium]